MSIKVIHGANEALFDLSDQPIEIVAEKLRDILNMPSHYISYLDGQVVSNEHVLSNENKVLEFLKPCGHKGGLQDFWSENEIVELFGDDVVEQMKKAEIDFEPDGGLPKSQVIYWVSRLQDQEAPQYKIPVRVDIQKETIQMNGMSYDIDQEMAAVVKCLLDAKGRPVSTTEMRNAFPEYILNDRIDNVIHRKLRKHKSGIGDFIESSNRGYYLTCFK